MPEDKVLEFAKLWHRVGDLTKTLPESQKELLNFAMKLAWVVTATDEQLRKGFNESFTPEQAELVHDFHSDENGVQLLPRLFRGFIKL
jgi:hypothetical protein